MQLSPQRHQKYLETQNSRRNYDFSTLEQVQLQFRNVINTGINDESILLYQFPCEEQVDITKNIAKNSFTRAILPFDKDSYLKELFVKFDSNEVRIGKVLEIMDLLAGTVCYKHLKILKEHNYVCVTASVDDFEIFGDNININQTLKLDAYLTYVGTKTLEVRVDLIDQSNILQLSVKFLFVAKYNPQIQISYNNNSVNYRVLSPEEQKNFSMVQVPKLNIENDEDQDLAQLLYYTGKQKQKLRIQNIQQSTFKQPPTSQESLQIHHLLMTQVFDQKDKVVKIQDTKRDKFVLSHVADKNFQNTTFGGTMMRECYELAFITSYLYSEGNYPNLVSISDTQFLAPVPYGSMIKFEAYITYQWKNFIHCYVCASAISKEQKKWDQFYKTNEFNVIFETKNLSSRLVPVSYKEAMMYIEGERKVKHLFDQFNQIQFIGKIKFIFNQNSNYYANLKL